MPDRRPIDALQARLAEAMGEAQVFRALEWGNPRAMTQALRDIRTDLFDAGDAPPSSDLVQASLRRFGATKRVENFTELKYVCHGITVPVGDERWRVIDNGPLFNRLLTLVDEQQARPKQYRRCYQGLLHGYFGFNRVGSATSPAEVNWKTLRGFLDSRLNPIVQAATHRGLCPTWLGTLSEHRNLLTDSPCRRYADALAGGNTEELRSVCAGLGIPDRSWVWDEALMAYVQAVCKRDDRPFQEGLSGVLQLVNGRLDLKLPETLAKRATAMTVVRYSRCSERPEHTSLRDTCFDKIGDPRKSDDEPNLSWDTLVRDERAREMVEGWIKRRLIRDFFEHLAADGTADQRRLNFWLKWEPQISRMWFVLGANALRDKSPAFRALRARMADQAKVLVDNDEQNNAFIMKIGDLLVIEFGKENNACFAYHSSNFRANLATSRFDTNRDLKQKEDARRLIHNGSWEPRFDEALRLMLRTPPFKASQAVRPSPSPSPALSAADFQAICKHCTDYRVEWEDNRPNGGALWILITDPKRLPRLSVRLRSLGFSYKEGRGFWIKG